MRDGHWNAKGHQLAAGFMADELIARKLLDGQAIFERPLIMRVCKIWDADYPWDIRVEKVVDALGAAGHSVGSRMPE